MFTGIVEEVGEVRAVRAGSAAGSGPATDVVRLEIAGPVVTDGTRHGESIAVNGVCLTAVEVTGESLSVDLVPETLRRSSLSGVAAGSRVNLERALAAGQRLGGHIVQGHVDGVATVVARHDGERSAELELELPAGLARYVVEKGSITVDGVSLTIAGTDFGAAGDRFSVALIPTTLADTTLGERRPGDRVNIEVDVLAKYVERLLSGYLPGLPSPAAAARRQEGGAGS